MLLRRTILATTAAALLSIASPPAAAQQAFTGPVLLTVTGAVDNQNRGAFDPGLDKFFGFNEVEFSNAAEFDYDSLAALDMVKVRADFPKGADVHEFEGPLLADVLFAAGATGETVTIQALDGYAVELDAEEAIANGAVVALKRNGAPLTIGGFGPTHVVFPRADREDLANMPDDNWVWSIFHIKVE